MERFLWELRGELKAGRFRPSPVRERAIPKRGGALRYLGIPTLRDRVVQMALKLVLEPIFEADFYPSSYGYRPARRAQDAIAEIVHFTMPPSGYELVIEADIRGLLRSHRPRPTVGSPLLANVALTGLDRRYAADLADMSRHAGRRQYLRKMGHPTSRLVRFADDLVVLVKGTQAQAEALLAELAERVASIGLTVKPEKTRLTHIDAGFVFLGQRIIRRPKGPKRYVYTLVGDEALASAKRRVKALTGRSTKNRELSELLRALNLVLRGWAAYFR